MLELFTDGASRGNPGVSGCGAVLYLNGIEVSSSTKYLGRKTNNESEYEGLVLGLDLVKEFLSTNNTGLNTLTVKMDSKLVICQVSGLWRVKSGNLRPLFIKCKEMINHLKSSYSIGINLEHIYRNLNTVADRLANIAIDENL